MTTEELKKDLEQIREMIRVKMVEMEAKYNCLILPQIETVESEEKALSNGRLVRGSSKIFVTIKIT